MKPPELLGLVPVVWSVSGLQVWVWVWRPLVRRGLGWPTLELQPAGRRESLVQPGWELPGLESSPEMLVESVLQSRA